MKPKALILFLLVLLMSGVVSQSVFAAAEAQFAIPHLVVNTSFLNVRSGDGPQFSTIVTVVGGTELPVLASNSSFTWYLVTTAVGPGWVDISFTLPRGDFTNVPVVKPAEPIPVVVSTPLTIGLFGSTTTFTVAPLTTVPTGARAQVNVISVNLRTQPADNAPVIGILFKDGVPDYGIAGSAYDDRGVAWVAIVVPGMGTGWIEAAKTTTIQGTATTTAASNTVPVPVLSSSHVVVNTSFQNIRRGPGPQYAVLTVVPGGTALNVVGVTSDTTWYLVSGTFGQGWIASEFVLFRGTFSNVPILYSPF
jgi:uncharacterized protein YgiM (DUF1202 family)